MKKFFFLLSFFFFLLSFSFSQEYGWKDISANMPEIVGFTDVQFIGDEGWITGGNSKIYYTPDGGATFSIQQLPAGSGITSSVFMKSATEGYAVTLSGKILHFINNEWTTLHEPGGTFYSVHFPPTLDVGYTCGNNGKIYSFDNSNITDLSEEGLTATLQSIMFPETTDEGKLCGNATIRRYFNNTWNNLQIFDNRFYYNSIFFFDNNVGWVVGSDGQIQKTIDASSWYPKMSGTSENLNDVFFVNSQDGWVTGSNILLHTIDGGTTWDTEAYNLTNGKNLRALYFISSNIGYVVGNNKVLKYGDITGIDDKKEITQIYIYLNPAGKKFGVRSLEIGVNGGTLEIYDLNGRKLLENQIPKGSETIEVDASSLQSGIYFCRLIFENKNATQKLVIQK